MYSSDKLGDIEVYVADAVVTVELFSVDAEVHLERTFRSAERRRGASRPRRMLQARSAWATVEADGGENAIGRVPHEAWVFQDTPAAVK